MKYVFTFFSIFFLNLLFFESIAQKDACGTTTSINYGGQTYQTIGIGTQCWMKQNLNYGVKITSTTSSNQTNNGIVEKYCYNNDDANCVIYGGLYQWAEMVKYYRNVTNITSWQPSFTGPLQGICPPGWHIPTSTEWKTLFQFYDPTYNPINNVTSSIVGGKLKEVGNAHWNNNTGANDQSGFSAFGGGFYNEPNFLSLKAQGYFASLDDAGFYNSKYVYLYANSSNAVLDLNVKGYGLSVRCLKGNGVDYSSGIENNKLDLNEVIDVFPNPANQVLNFNFKKNEIVEIHVFIINAVGEIVFSKLITKENFALNNTIKVEKLPAGNYFFKVELNNKIYSKKIIIERK